MAAQAQDVDPRPGSPEETQALLDREPITLDTWRAWRERLLAWQGDETHATDSAYQAASAFALATSPDGGASPHADLANDFHAWYSLGAGQIYEAMESDYPAAMLSSAELALRGALRLNPDFARSHRNLAFALLAQSSGAQFDIQQEAQEHLDAAQKLDPSLDIGWVRPQAAVTRQDYSAAETLWGEQFAKDSTDRRAAYNLADSIVRNDAIRDSRAGRMAPIVAAMPDDGVVACFNGLALAIDNDLSGALHEFDRGRSLGVDPRAVLGDNLVDEIEAAAAPGFWKYALWTSCVFAGVYALVMLTMAIAGLALARMTRGTKALNLIGGYEAALVEVGQVHQTLHETWLARLYKAALLAGLVLFYCAIPFVSLGVLTAAGLLLYGFVLVGRIPIKLSIFIAIGGIIMAWSILKSVFARAERNPLDTFQNPNQQPRLYAAASEVAARIETEPVDAIYLGPGAEIGVRQEGRGPFGMFGVKSRELTVGAAALQLLTVGELKSILAHEYAHFSHGDTFFSRFIYQVQMSIEESLGAMGATMGKLNYVNPFFWFMYLYYRCYSLMAAGFSRSREFLADRMAASLYGGDVFQRALHKVSTHGAWAGHIVFTKAISAFNEQRQCTNLFNEFRVEQLAAQDTTERDKLFDKALNQRTTLFSTHPSFQDRTDAVEAFPDVRMPESEPARELLDDPEGVEAALTRQVLEHLRRMAELAAAQQEHA